MRAAIMKQLAHTSHTDKYKTCRLFNNTQIPLVSDSKRLVMLQQSNYMLLCASFWVIPWHLNFICQCFGTLCLFRLRRRVGNHPPRRRNRHNVPKHWHIKFRRQGITQKKAYNIQNKAKVLKSKLHATSRQKKADHNKGWKRQLWIAAYRQDSTVHTSYCMLQISHFGELMHALSPDGVSTLTWWGSSRASVTRRAMPAVAQLLVGSPKLDRSKGKPDEESHPGPPGWGLGIRPATLSRKKIKTTKNAQFLKAGQMNNRREEWLEEDGSE